MWPKICLTSSTDLLHPFTCLAPLSLLCPCLAPSPPNRLLLSLIYVLVTVQIYLSRSAKRTATGGSLAASTVTARSATSPQLTAESSKASTARRVGTASKVPPARKTPSLNIQLRKTGSLSSYSPLDTPSYRSPIKSPSQYFQICY